MTASLVTITVWLLLNVGDNSSRPVPTTLIDRFATAEECERVANVLRGSTQFKPANLRCVQATVVKP